MNISAHCSIRCMYFTMLFLYFYSTFYKFFSVLWNSSNSKAIKLITCAPFFAMNAVPATIFGELFFR